MDPISFFVWAFWIALSIILVAGALFVAAAIISVVVTKLREEHQRKRNQE
jgi:hypothetical protein